MSYAATGRPKLADQLRHRIVTDQDGQQIVHSVVLSLDEAASMLDLDERMHRETGWDVTRYGACIRCRKGHTVRWVWIRSKDPMEDTL